MIMKMPVVLQNEKRAIMDFNENNIETDFEQEIMERWEEEAKTKDISQRRGRSRIWILLGIIYLIGLILMSIGKL